MVAVNAADDDNVAAVAIVRPHPQSLPAFIGLGVRVPRVGSLAFIVPRVGASSAVSSSASLGGATCKTNTPAPPRRSLTSLSSNISSGGGGGGEKTKHSTNRERGSISKAMDRMVELIGSGGGGQWEKYDDLNAVNADTAAEASIFNGDGCRQEQDGVANCWGVCLFVVDNASAALKKSNVQ